MQYLIRFITLFLALLLVSCVSSQILSTHSAPIDQDEVGTFDLILYGMQTAQDVESVAILDRTGDAYQIEAANRVGVREIVKDLTASEASQRASKFLGRSVVINRIDTRKIIGPQGEPLGYELRPIFYEFQVSNRFYHIWYYLAEPELVKFRVEWNQLKEPFSSD